MSQALPAHCDIAIVGGGPVGAALALALEGSGHSVVLLESREPAAVPDDPRAIALSWLSRLLLDRCGAWHALAPRATAIDRVHVSQRGGFGRCVLRARDAGVPALGYVVSYVDLWQALRAALAGSAARVVTGAPVESVRDAGAYATVTAARGEERLLLTARLVAVADGGASLGALAGVEATSRAYGQQAVVARVQTDRPHGGIAWERFTPGGPIALLPFGDAFALVWTLPESEAEPMRALPEGAFLGALQECFGSRAGRFTAAGARSAVPLALRFAPQPARGRVALVGNAAQALHPVAGQGFNLGLRDAWELAQAVREAPAEELGTARMLAGYRARRRLDRSGGIAFTDLLVRVFSSDLAPLALARGAGLAALGLLPPLRDAFARRMMFGAGL